MAESFQQTRCKYERGRVEEDELRQISMSCGCIVQDSRKKSDQELNYRYGEQLRF